MNDYRNESEKNYFGADLNKFINTLPRIMTCINIDCLLYKKSQNRLRFIESKHTNEKLTEDQKKIFAIISEISKSLKKQGFETQVEMFNVKGDFPYNETELFDFTNKQTYKLNNSNLKKWLCFDYELQDCDKVN